VLPTPAADAACPPLRPRRLPTATPQPEPTPTLQFPTDDQPAAGFSLPLPDERLARPLVGALPALLLVIVAFLIGLYTMRRK
jgi:hypothetical protein